MRRIGLILLLVLLTTTSLVHAQVPEPTPENPAQVSSFQLESILREIEAASVTAREHAEDAARYANDASNFLGIFEAISVAITFIVGALGVVGLTRLFSAQNQLTEVRKQVVEEVATLRGQFDEEIAQRRKELTELNDLVRQTAEQQRLESERATLALSMLPLGERQYRAQDLKGAYDTYLRALELDSNNPIIHYRLGYVAVQSDQLENAEYHLKCALEIDAQFALAQAALGFTYRRMTDSMPDTPERDLLYNRAEHNFLQALTQSPKLVDDDGESWWGSLGGLYRRRGQTDQAIKAYERAAEVTPYSSYPFSNLAMLYMRTQDRDRMMKMFRRVERIAHAETQAEVDNYWAYADLLTSRLVLGKTETTEDILTTMFEIAPTETDYPLESLADTLQRLLDTLGADSNAARISQYIARIRQRIADRKITKKP